MTGIQDKAAERREIEDLLPWHATGTLNRRDAERVEKALLADRELARHFDLVRDELAETIHLNESLGAPSARAAEKLFAAIDAEPVRKPAFRLDLSTRFANFVASFAPRTLAYAATAAALAIVLQAGVLTSVLLKDQGDGNTVLASADKADAYVLIRFAPTATADEINKFLNEYRVTQLEPKTGGMFKVSLAVPTRSASMSKQELAAAVKSMQNETKVVNFVSAPTE